MCGISGIIGAEGPVLHSGIKSMTNRLAHRGPDAEGYFIEAGVALGHRRLSIIDLSTAANQPMNDTSGRYVIVYNGELYNFREVKGLLPDYPYQTNSDSEVVLASYARWGAGCLKHFNGMFAFAIWDKRKRELFFARDRLGVKPLYYYTEGQHLVFASELRAVLASGIVSPKLDMNAVCNYMMYQSVYAPFTVIQSVFQMMPGEYGIFKDGRLEKYIYWRLEDSGEPIEDANADKVRHKVKHLLSESVARRMVSDVPIGAFLSGGIDSSAVVGLMAQCSEQPVNTFSINFSEPEYDESYYSSLIARRFRTRHTPLLLGANDFLESFPKALESMDSPSGDGFNSWLVSKMTKQAGITVALSGIGGDELFAGYSGFIRWFRLRKAIWWAIPQKFRNLSGNLLRLAANSPRTARLADLIAAETPDIEHVYPAFRQIMNSEQSKKLLQKIPQMEDSAQRLLFGRREKIHKLPVLSQYSAAELLGYTMNVLLKDTDQMGMASALEVREPFFDYQLIEYVLQISDTIKYPRYAKSLLVDALSPLLPDEIVHRPKRGFTLPWKLWLRNDLRPWCEQNLKNLAERPAFNGDEIRKLGSQFFNRPSNNNWAPVFLLAVLEDWLERNQLQH